MSGRIRLGMVGGGRGAFIGAVHRRAALLDGMYELCAGALSSTPEKSLESGRDIGLPDDRIYESWEQMLEQELKLPEERRIEAVSVVTPNHLHYPVVKAFTEAGFHVICDKPLVHNSREAEELVRLCEEKRTVCAVTYTYAGYPMVKQAADMVSSGVLGNITKVMVIYLQEWMLTADDKDLWRADPEKSGISGAVADIGTHGEYLISLITGLQIDQLCAEASRALPGRQLEDGADILLRFTSGARGLITVSQACAGEENGLQVKVFGEKGSLSWQQENPNYLSYAPLGQPEQILKRGNDYLCASARSSSSLPHGHPEGFLEAFADIYRNAGKAILSSRGSVSGERQGFPTVRDGMRGVRFVEKVIESIKQDARWMKMD